MLDVDYAQFEIPPWGEFMERMQQENGIAAAGDSDTDTLPAFEHAVSRDEFRYALEHSSA
jgi:hypothetical protein